MTTIRSRYAVRNVGTTRAGLAIMHIFLLGMAIAVMSMVNIPDKNENVIMLLVGALIGNTGNIVGFYFNNSSRSARGSE